MHCLLINLKVLCYYYVYYNSFIIEINFKN